VKQKTLHRIKNHKTPPKSMSLLGKTARHALKADICLNELSKLTSDNIIVHCIPFKCYLLDTVGHLRLSRLLLIGDGVVLTINSEGLYYDETKQTSNRA
jgi:hypothetical protein